MERRLEAAIRAVIRFFDDHQYRYALIGGIALAQWGVVRATYDADFKVLVPDLDYAAVRQAIRSAFLEPARQELPHNPLIVAIIVEDVIVDLLLALPGYEELIIERAVLRDLGGWQAWISTADDLIIQKVVASRDKDWLDVEALLIERRGKLRANGHDGPWLPLICRLPFDSSLVCHESRYDVYFLVLFFSTRLLRSDIFELPVEVDLRRAA